MTLYWKYDFIWRVAKLISCFLLPIVPSIFFKWLVILFLMEIALRTKFKSFSQLLLPLSPSTYRLLACSISLLVHIWENSALQHALVSHMHKSGIKLSRQLFSNCEQSLLHSHTLFPHSLCLHWSLPCRDMTTQENVKWLIKSTAWCWQFFPSCLFHYSQRGTSLEK